jgi:hypothetical protein
MGLCPVAVKSSFLKINVYFVVLSTTHLLNCTLPVIRYISSHNEARNMTMDNFQNCDSYINILSIQRYISYETTS